MTRDADCGHQLGCLYDPPCDEHSREPTAIEMVEQLDKALHGTTWARPLSPMQTWWSLLAEVKQMRKRVPVREGSSDD